VKIDAFYKNGPELVDFITFLQRGKQKDCGCLPKVISSPRLGNSCAAKSSSAQDKAVPQKATAGKIYTCRTTPLP
jgi:hypothetical protein